MSREIDRRDPAANQITDNRIDELQATASIVSDQLPGGHRLRIERFDSATGNPAQVVSDAAPAEKGRFVERAMEHLQQINKAMGLTATQAAEYAAAPQEQSTSSGAIAVHLQQKYKGITIFQACTTVRFSTNGALREAVGASYSVAEELSVDPIISVEDAVMIAAQQIAEPDDDEMDIVDQFGERTLMNPVNLEGFAPQRLSFFAGTPEQASVIKRGPFEEDIPANLTWFPLANTLRLSWELLFSLPSFEGQYRVLVDAENSEILYCHQTIHSVAARGSVYEVDGSAGRQMVNFPRELNDYGLTIPNNLPAGFPDDWVDGDRTLGGAVDAHLGANGTNLQGVQQGGEVVFDPADATGDEQKVLNIFYYNCVMHDFFYLLGFNEVSGNFQNDNMGRGGRSGDRVDARSHSGPVNGTANMLTPADGSAPIMNMGLVSSTNRHTAFDSSVVFHEFMHGVTNRLVGGSHNSVALDAPQSGGMGEGWGDYIACTINNQEVVGAWVVNNPNGIRGFRYDSNFPDGFGDLGTGRYTGVHNIGEIWCATLLEMNRAIGKALGLELVMDALKLSPANPSFLDMRDAILAALDEKLLAAQLTPQQHETAQQSIWEVFARFGMGVDARSNGAFLSGIVADNTVPATAAVSTVSEISTPGRVIPDRDATGITDSISVTQTGIINNLIVSVDIQHTFIGDLRVRLSTPTGADIILHRGEGGSANDLVRSYSSLNNTELALLLGEDVDGTWELQVIDVFSQDIGTLREWGLEIELAP